MGPLVTAPDLARAMDAPPLPADALGGHPLGPLARAALGNMTSSPGDASSGHFVLEASPGRAARVRECSLLL